MSESINAGGYFIDSCTGEVKLKLMSVNVKGESRKANATWTIAAISDLKEETENPLEILKIKEWLFQKKGIYFL